MSYAIRLTESLFPAQTDSQVQSITIGEQLKLTAQAYPQETALVEVDIDGDIGRSWTWSSLLT